MLTVKHRLPSGHEYVVETKRVSYQPSSSIEDTPAVRTVFIEHEDGSVAPFDTGVFYVMNEAGNTVAKYEL
jgi:hypothetical protein